MLDIWNSS